MVSNSQYQKEHDRLMKLHGLRVTKGTITITGGKPTQSGTGGHLILTPFHESRNKVKRG